MSGFCPHHSTILLHGWLNKENEWCSYILSPLHSIYPHTVDWTGEFSSPGCCDVATFCPLFTLYIPTHGWLNKENEWCSYILSPLHSIYPHTVDWTRKMSDVATFCPLFTLPQSWLHKDSTQLTEQRKWVIYLLPLHRSTVTNGVYCCCSTITNKQQSLMNKENDLVTFLIWFTKLAPSRCYSSTQRSFLGLIYQTHAIQVIH